MIGDSDGCGWSLVLVYWLYLLFAAFSMSKSWAPGKIRDAVHCTWATFFTLESVAWHRGSIEVVADGICCEPQMKILSRVLGCKLGHLLGNVSGFLNWRLFRWFAY